MAAETAVFPKPSLVVDVIVYTPGRGGTKPPTPGVPAGCVRVWPMDCPSTLSWYTKTATGSVAVAREKITIAWAAGPVTASGNAPTPAPDESSPAVAAPLGALGEPVPPPENET